MENSKRRRGATPTSHITDMCWLQRSPTTLIPVGREGVLYLPCRLEKGSGRQPPVAKAHTANEGPVRIQYKCLVPIYVFPEMKCVTSLYTDTWM